MYPLSPQLLYGISELPILIPIIHRRIALLSPLWLPHANSKSAIASPSAKKKEIH